MALLNTPPNTKHSNITNLTISPSIPAKNTPKAAYPSISHSTVSESVFTNLTGSSGISHSSLKNTRVALSPIRSPAGNGDGNAAGASCGIEGKATRIKHADLTSTCLTNVDYANHLKATDSVLSSLSSISRANIKNTSIGGGGGGSGMERIQRAEIRDSVLTGTEVQRCKLDCVRVVGSKLRRAQLKDCDVQNCVILRTELKGMKLRNEVWKNARLLGDVAGGETGAGSSTASPPVSSPASPASPPAQRHAPLVPKTKEEKVAQAAFWQEHHEGSESESRSEDDDMPPPYAP